MISCPCPCPRPRPDLLWYRHCVLSLEFTLLTFSLGWHSTVLDKTSMFTVFSQREGETYRHSVKPLQIIWNHFKELYVYLHFHIERPSSV